MTLFRRTLSSMWRACLAVLALPVRAARSLPFVQDRSRLVWGARTLSAPIWRRTLRGLCVCLGLCTFAGLQILLAHFINEFTWWYIAALYVVAVTVVIVAARPTAAFIIWLSVSPVAMLLLKLDWGRDMPALTFDRVAIYSLAMFLVFRTMANRVRPRRPLVAEWLLIAFPAYVFVRMWTQPHRFLVRDINVYLAIVVISTVLYFLSKASLMKPKHAVWVMKALVFVGLYSALFGFYEHFTGKMWFSSIAGTDFLLKQGFWGDVGSGRSAGPFGNPTVYGTFLGLSTFLAFHLAAYTRRVDLKLFYYAGAVVMVIGWFWCYTRGGYIGVIMFLVLMPLFARGIRKQYLVLFVIGAVLVVLAIPMLLTNREIYQRMTARDTAVGRIAIAATMINAWKHNLWFGVGLNQVDYAIEQYITNAGSVSGMWVRGGNYQWPQAGLRHIITSHNSFLSILVEYGTVGALIYYGALLAFILRLLAIRKRGPAHDMLGQDFVSLILVFILGHLISIAVYDVRYFTYMNYVFWILIAVVIRLDELAQEEEAPAKPALVPAVARGVAARAQLA